MPSENEHFSPLSPANIKSATDFIAELVSEAHAQGRFDSDLLEILEKYILNYAPVTDAVEQAAAEIMELAKTRAEDVSND